MPPRFECYAGDLGRVRRLRARCGARSDNIDLDVSPLCLGLPYNLLYLGAPCVDHKDGGYLVSLSPRCAVCPVDGSGDAVAVSRVALNAHVRTEVVVSESVLSTCDH